MLGRSYAAGGYASDIRLACFGLDTNDNEFVIGLVGAELYPLSRLIQDMRQTEQTTKYIESLWSVLCSERFDSGLLSTRRKIGFTHYLSAHLATN